MKPKIHRLQAVFLKALQAPTPQGRAAVLERECDGDEELERLASQLLRKHDLQGQALDTPAVDLLPTLTTGNAYTTDDTEDLCSGVVIAGRYRLLDRLGVGGMGSVYRAEQVAPVRRTVAVKVIRAGLCSKSLLARFESERQALARMNHPNIAKIYDAGMVETRPYFVMELVDGLPVTEFCASEKLPLRRRLELFLLVCQAVEHAHQKGVIHRDLKPANILVARRDGAATPTVIDFGIAKSLEAQVDDGARQTGWGQFLGTFDYMAPEQLAGHAADIDTRTDVYSLGALLYELLCGRVPLDRDHLRDASIFELAGLLREQQPRRPSARAASPPAGVLRGELDWITLKCLEKDPNRRYPSVRALADDLSRYLANEPVLAGPPTARYRLRKFIRRHRAAVAGSGLLLVALVGGIAGTTWGMIRAQRAEAVAVNALDDKETARANEEKERLRAEAKAAQLKFVSNFIQFDVLQQANPTWQSQAGFAPDANLTVKTALDRSAATIEKRFGKHPLVVASLFQTVGATYDGLGDYDSAVRHLRQAYEIYEQRHGPHHAQTVGACHALAWSLTRGKKTAEAIPLFEKNLSILRNTAGPDHEKVLTAETGLALALLEVGRPDEAESLFRHVYHTNRARSANSGSTIQSLMNLAAVDEHRGRIDEAIRKLQSLPGILPPDGELNPRTKITVGRALGRFHFEVGRRDEAIGFLQSARDTARGLHGEEHHEHLDALVILSDAYVAAGRSADAVALLEQTHKRLQANLPTFDVRIHRVALELARAALEGGDHRRAESVAQDVECAALSSGGRDSHVRALAMITRGRCLYLSGRAGDAEPLTREGVRVLTAWQKGDWQTHEARVLLGLVLAAQGRLADAEPELTRGYKGLKGFGHRLLHVSRRRMAEALDGLARCAEKRDQPTDAARRAEPQLVQ